MTTMRFWDKFFGGKGQSAPQRSAVCRLIAEYLDCPCEYIPEGTEYGEVAEIFDAAVAEGREQGYCPVLIAANEGNLVQSLYDNAGLERILQDNVGYGDAGITVKEGFAFSGEQRKALREYRTKLVAEWSENDAEKFLQERAAESTAYDEDFDIDEYWGGEDEGITFEDIRPGISVPFDFRTEKSYEMLLAKIPAAAPWQIAAWLPMGNWNECPNPKDMLAMAKRWYEQYGAVICCISSDQLEWRVSNPPTDFEEAYGLAKEQYYFCEDRVTQYAGDYNLKTLANGLTQSPYWYFWWD